METFNMLKHRKFIWHNPCFVGLMISGLFLAGCQSTTQQSSRNDYSLSAQQGHRGNNQTMVNGPYGYQPAVNNYDTTKNDLSQAQKHQNHNRRKQHFYVDQRAPGQFGTTENDNSQVRQDYSLNTKSQATSPSNNLNGYQRQYHETKAVSHQSVVDNTALSSQKDYSRMKAPSDLPTKVRAPEYNQAKPTVEHVYAEGVPEEIKPSTGVLGVAHVANYGLQKPQLRDSAVASETTAVKYNLSPGEMSLSTPQSPVYSAQERSSVSVNEDAQPYQLHASGGQGMIPASSQFRADKVVLVNQSPQDQIVAITANLKKLIDDPDFSPADVGEMQKTVLSLADELGRKKGIEISHLEICKPQTVKGFGDYIKMSRQSLGSGAPLTFNIYFELVNFETSVRPNGKHLANIAASIKLALLEDDGRVHHVISGVGMTMKKVDDKGSFQKRKDYYISGMFDLPRLVPGKYQLIVSVEDRIAGKTAKPARYAFEVRSPTKLNSQYNDF